MKTIFIFLVFVQVAQAAQLTPAEAIRLLRKNAVVATSQTRSGVAAILRSIEFTEIMELEGYTMTEVLTFLDSKIKEQNPNINFIIGSSLNQNAPNIAPNVVAQPVEVDPLTGLPIQGAVPNVNNPNVNNQRVAFNPDDVKIIGLKTKLRNLNMLQLIELVTLSFDTPIQFTITNYGVVFFPLPADQAGQVSRMFRIKPNTLSNGTPPTLGGSKMNQSPLNNTPRMGRSPLNINK